MKTNAEVLREARVRAISEGKCIICRKNQVTPGKKSDGTDYSTCTECRNVMAMRADKNRKLGLCSCGRRLRPKGGTCRPCYDRKNFTRRS